MKIKISTPAGQTSEQVIEHLEQWRRNIDAAIESLPPEARDKLKKSRARAHAAARRLGVQIVVQ